MVPGSAAVSAGGILPAFSAKSYGNIGGANERINLGVVGVNSRGYALAANFASQKNCRVTYICVIDSRAVEKCVAHNSTLTGERPTSVPDFRKALENSDLDAVIIATPDHWHAPAALLAMKAGKHVYLKKPCSHSPEEGEMLVKSAARYNRTIRMGNQRRSWPNVVRAIEEIKSGTTTGCAPHPELL